MRSIAGISGGRTSAFMAYDLPQDTILCFQNTGKEHSKTLDFLCRVEDDLQREIVRLEYRSPPRGDPPRLSSFQIVNRDQLARKGEPFRDMLDCLATFRAKHKGLGPISPWARQRLCTSYLKIKTQKAYTRSLGWDDFDYTTFLGLRFDEPDRVALMRARNDSRDGDERAPLFDRGIVKDDVLSFWSRKSFDLEIPEYLGNCTGCFLKDERDLADALADLETDALFWIGIEETYGPMRIKRASYAQVFSEIPERLSIRSQLAAGTVPRSNLLPRRHLAILRQEKEPRASPISCGCEGAERLAIESGDDL